MEFHKTIIIGASAAGLACAARLAKEKHDYIILEKQNHVGHNWRNHYDRLHLHTPKASSHLPFIKFPSSTPKYPSRREVVSYLENYTKVLGIYPIYNTLVESARKENDHWLVSTNHHAYSCVNLIVCTGNTNIPKRLESFKTKNFEGEVIHSAEYKNGKSYKDKEVLVVGFGNSACEIAICLHEHGAIPSLSVRSAVNVLPRDIMGISVLQLGIAQASLSPKIADVMNKPLINLLIGNIEKYGLKKLPYGPIEQIVKHHQVPLLDIGTMKLIKEGKIKVFDDIKSVSSKLITFENGQVQSFDAINMATGYETGLEKVLPISKERLSDSRINIKKRKHFGEDNLYLCGFFVAPTGMI